MEEENFLGVSFFSPDFREKTKQVISDEMERIQEKYQALAMEEFDKFLSKKGLENQMGMIIRKG